MKLPALTHCPVLLSEHGNDFKVKWVSGVHDNIFRQTTVVNHLQVPLGAVRFRRAAGELQMAEVLQEKSGVRGMSIDPAPPIIC